MMGFWGITRHELRDWLASKAPDEKVGVAGRATACPAAVYAQDQLLGNIQVGVSVICQGPRVQWAYNSPTWLVKFFSRIDQLRLVEELRGERPFITAKEALTVLDNLDLPDHDPALD